jgi:uncharacterized protein DUF1707
MSRPPSDESVGRSTAVDYQTLASDADRDEAAAMLNEAFAEGRLTPDEHGDRVQAAYGARTWTELGRLTMDLPGADADLAPDRQLAVGLVPAGLDRCLLCALLVLCPPAGIAWLVAARRRTRAGADRATAGASRAPALDSRHAEDR